MIKENLKKINELPLYIHASYEKDGKLKEIDIQTRQGSKQDCMLSDFAENWYMRPKKSVNYGQYKNIGTYKTAIKRVFKNNTGFDLIDIYEKITVNDTLYQKNI